ncbi:MAG: gamma-glutamyl-gamma-aminobutyrate hydrolase family protein [Candidatus Omnitrophota bacterium]
MHSTIKFSRPVIISLFFLVFILTLSAQSPIKQFEQVKQTEITIAMCRPEVSQIKNIEQLFEKDLIPLRRIKLIGVYHEDENTDYAPALKYVQENNLSWVTFKMIKGQVKGEDLFKENAWTPQFNEIVKTTQGIIFTGGWDFPPRLYGEDQLLATEFKTPARHYYEVSFLFHLLGGSQNPAFVPLLESKKNYAVLGICLGCQTMNIACGGTLYQDIPQQVYGFSTVEQVLTSDPDAIHSSRYVEDMHPTETDLSPAFHRIKFAKSSYFVRRMKTKESDTPYVLTSHHQALKKLGKNLTVAATSMDGKIIEAIEHTAYKNVLGIQFHPEPYALYLKGKYFRKSPGEPLDFNLREFLQTHSPSLEFHQKIWQWFSEIINY